MPDTSGRNSALLFVILTYGFSWAIVITAAFLTTSLAIQFAAVAVSAFGPAIAALILVWRSDHAVVNWVQDVFRWKVSKQWYLAAIGIPLIGIAVQTGAYVWLVGDIQLSVLPRRFVMLLGTFPVALLITGGNEELGWRGYLLPQLQQTYSALTGSIVVGIVWLIWHLPSDFLLTALGGGLVWTPGRIAMRLGVIPLAIILTWLYNGSQGSVFLAMIFHAGWNSYGILAPIPIQTEGVTASGAATLSTLQVVPPITMALVALLIVLRYDPETLSPKDKCVGLAR